MLRLGRAPGRAARLLVVLRSRVAGGAERDAERGVSVSGLTHPDFMRINLERAKLELPELPDDATLTAHLLAAGFTHCFGVKYPESKS